MGNKKNELKRISFDKFKKLDKKGKIKQVSPVLTFSDQSYTGGVATYLLSGDPNSGMTRLLEVRNRLYKEANAYMEGDTINHGLGNGHIVVDSGVVLYKIFK